MNCATPEHSRSLYPSVHPTSLPNYSQVGMSENATPSEGTLETCLFDYLTNDLAILKVIFLGRRGAGDLLRLSTVTNLTVIAQ